MRLLLVLFILTVSNWSFAQKSDWKPQGWEKGNTYRSSSNPLYWKNKKPYEGYWQQDVYYRINATLDDSSEVITGTEVLMYYNNSPNTLTEAFFHLYQNAVQPGSLVDELYHANKTPHKFGKYEVQNKGTEITHCAVNGVTVLPVITNTIMRLPLAQPLKSGDSVQFYFSFKTYFDRGTIRRRMKVYDHDGFKHFNGVHWYPRICVYDRKFTWETAQHMEHEFYGDYGSFDVELKLPNEYVNEATGNLLNPETAYPGDLRKRLDISNYKDRLKDDKPALVAPRTGELKTWRYHANNVHDFAWTADPTYRIGEVMWNGIQCIALAQEQNAWRWQPTAQLVADVVSIYSKDFGMYEYPKMVAADAADGMEYPMLTLDGGIFPSHRGLIAHEVGHNWFFGMVGNNETYRAAMDEGFTQFLTAWSMKILTNQNRRPSDVEYNTNYFGYVRDAIDGTDPTLNTHSDDFQNAIGHGGGYGHVYYKTATMLYNLEYVLGDTIFKRAMQDYVRQWKICHPYIEDFRNSIIMSAGTDLNWFFDQWFETSKYIDYSIKKVKSNTKGQQEIVIQRKGDMIMPVDLRIILEGKRQLNITIPVSYYKKPGSAHPLEPWIGWGRLRKTYVLPLTTNEKITAVSIDPSGRLADIDMRNNQWKRRFSMVFDRENALSRDHRGNYIFYWRPDVWYSHWDGLRAGLKISGNYAARKHIFNLYLWGQNGETRLTSGAQKFAYWFDHRHFMRLKGEFVLGSRFLANVWIHQAGWEKSLRNGRFSLGFKYLQQQTHHLNYQKPIANNVLSNAYLPEQGHWSNGNNFSVNLAYLQSYTGFKNRGTWEVKLRSTAPWSDASYSYTRFTWLNQLKLGKAEFRTRMFAQTGTGLKSAAESMIYASGANPEELQDNKVARDWANYTIGSSAINRQLHLGGGLNLRGFNGYGLPHMAQDSLLTFFRGNSGFAGNAELDFTRYFGFLSKLKWLGVNTYLFADGGLMAFPVNNKLRSSGFLADAGAGIMLSFQNWDNFIPRKSKPALSGLAPFRIRFDMPFFVSAVQEGEEYFAFRWLLGVNRSF